MERKCLKCGYERQGADSAPDTECPQCGAIYAKVEAAIKRGNLEHQKTKQELIEKSRKELEKEQQTATNQKSNSNLIICNDCRESVSKNADTCPHCGSPIKKQKNKGFGVGKILLSIFGVMLLIGIFSTDNDTQEVVTDSIAKNSVVRNSEWDGSVRQVERYLKNNLKDPDSYESIEWSPVTEAGEGHIVRVKYRAKNSFGGYVVENKVFLLDSKSKVLSNSDYDK